MSRTSVLILLWLGSRAQQNLGITRLLHVDVEGPNGQIGAGRGQHWRASAEIYHLMQYQRFPATGTLQKRQAQQRRVPRRRNRLITCPNCVLAWEEVG